MKRLILFPLVGFVASLGGATAYIVYSAPAVTAVADSLAVRPDTGRHDSASADTLPGNHAAAAPGTTPDSGAASHAVPPAEGATPPHLPVAPPGPGAPPVDRAGTPEAAARALANKQVARVLSAMKPPEAAKVLGYLSDDEVEGILRAVGPRQAADFLTNLPKERAADLSRRLLVPRPNEASR